MPAKKKSAKTPVRSRIKPKAKFSIENEPIAPAQPRMTVVTEVVDENAPAAEENPTPVAVTGIETPVMPQAATPGISEAADDGEGEVTTSVATPGYMPTQDEKTKEVVEELFKPSMEEKMMPEISVHTNGSSKKTIFIWAIVMIVIIVIIASGMIFLVRGAKLPSFAVKPQPTPTVAPTATPSPPNRADLTIEVLNGGGTPGAAGKMKKTLTDLGYQVSSTGNTESYSYEKTEIHVKSAKSAFIPLLTADLKDVYTLGTASADLAADATADAQVIVGK